MARLVLSKQDVADYIPEAFRAKPEGQPRFKLASLTGAQRQEIHLLRAGAYVSVDDDKARLDFSVASRSFIKAATYGLRGWEGVEDQDGQTIPWPGSAAKAVGLLPFDLALELGRAIVERSELTEEQRGN